MACPLTGRVDLTVNEAHCHACLFLEESAIFLHAQTIRAFLCPSQTEYKSLSLGTVGALAGLY